MEQQHQREGAIFFVRVYTFFGVLIWGLLPAWAQAFEIKLDPPGQREFISDRAGLLDAGAQDSIKSISDSLLSDKATPIIVVTIESMEKYGGEGMRIETFANLLFDQWQIGHENLGEVYWNTGILLLVSKGDRKARIELGAGWGRREDELCRQIMDQYIIPQFKKGDFSAGIVAGVEALDKMGRKLDLPESVQNGEGAYGEINPWWFAIIFGVLIFSIISLYRNGSNGWAWILWAAVFGVLGLLLMAMLSIAKHSSSGGGGGFSGGSFGGGFSGGGGASGSW